MLRSILESVVLLHILSQFSGLIVKHMKEMCVCGPVVVQRGRIGQVAIGIKTTKQCSALEKRIQSGVKDLQAASNK